MVNKLPRVAKIAPLAVLVALSLKGGDADSSPWLDVEFPRDSPVLTVSFSLGPSASRVQGASIALDLHASLVLRNTSAKPLSGLTLRVEAQDLVPSGKGSVMMPSLNVQPGEVFPVRVDVRLLRPFTVGRSEGAMVRVSLDCAVFNDLSSYGPDRLKSLRALLVYELEARRDRHYMAELLRNGRYAQLREELNFGLQDFHPQQFGLEMLREFQASEKSNLPISVGTLAFPSSPVRATGGAAQIAGNEVKTPRIEIKNSSQKPVRSVEVGWIVRSDKGRDFVVGSVPSEVGLGPVESGVVNELGTLRFSSPSGQPLTIAALMTFVNDVEFADGRFWIPSRADIDQVTSDPLLRRALASSPEQQRLADVFRRKGIRGLQEELSQAKW